MRHFKIKNIIVTFILIILIGGCNNERANTSIEESDFIYRLHTSDLEIDWYKLHGKITFEDFVNEFKRIDWETEYWKAYNTETFNFPDMEVIDLETSLYLSISVCPYTHEDYQFSVGLGLHNIKNEHNEIERLIKIFGTSTKSKKKIIKTIKAFFNGDLEKLEYYIKSYDFLDEIEDLYQNIEEK